MIKIRKEWVISIIILLVIIVAGIVYLIPSVNKNIAGEAILGTSKEGVLMTWKDALSKNCHANLFRCKRIITEYKKECSYTPPYTSRFISFNVARINRGWWSCQKELNSCDGRLDKYIKNCAPLRLG